MFLKISKICFTKTFFAKNFAKKLRINFFTYATKFCITFRLRENFRINFFVSRKCGGSGFTKVKQLFAVLAPQRML
jgi:hypothetical protein